MEMAGFEPASEYIAISASTFISQLFKVHCLERRWSGLTHTTSLIGLFLLLQAGAASVSPLLDKTGTAPWTSPAGFTHAYLLGSVCVRVWIIVCSYNLKLSVFTKPQPSKRSRNSNYTRRIHKHPRYIVNLNIFDFWMHATRISRSWLIWQRCWIY